MSAPYQFSVTKGHMVQLGVCFGLIQVLLYGAGIATGVLVAPDALKLPDKIPLSQAIAEKDGASAKGEHPAMGENRAMGENPATAAAGQPEQAKQIEQAQASAPATPTAQAAAIAQAPAASNPQAMANAAPTPTEMQLDSHLSVQVASFHDKDNALRLADVLKRQGFGKVTVGQYDSRNVTWHFVRLGPFRAWEDASRVASELDRSYDLRAYVLPAGMDDN
jgi:cell division septation protein DedD